jgi:hypothetical protein
MLKVNLDRLDRTETWARRDSLATTASRARSACLATEVSQDSIFAQHCLCFQVHLEHLRQSAGEYQARKESQAHSVRSVTKAIQALAAIQDPGAF